MVEIAKLTAHKDALGGVLKDQVCFTRISSEGQGKEADGCECLPY